jgi:hypothetical protein
MTMMENSENEIWKDVIGYEGLYQVSNLGRIKSLNYRAKGICEIMKFSLLDGYPSLSLTKNGKYKTYRIHRLVANAFVYNLHNKPQVNHKNGNRADNNVDNLEWVTNQENCIHSFKVLNRQTSLETRIKISNSRIKKVINTKTNQIFNSTRDACQFTGMTFSKLRKRLNGQIKNNTTFKYL